MDISSTWTELYTKIRDDVTLSALLGVTSNLRGDSADTGGDFTNQRVVIIIHSPTIAPIRFSGYGAQYIMTVESKKASKARDTQTALRSLLHGKTLTETGTTTIVCTGANPVGFDPEAARYRGSITFEVNGT